MSDPKTLISCIKTILVESAFPEEVDHETANHILGLFSKSPIVSLDAVTSVRSKPVSQLSISKLISILKKMVEMNILEAKPMQSILACPTCSSLSFKQFLQCPDCHSPQMNKAESLEHYSCRYSDFRSKFLTKQDKLVCPKCEKELKLIGVDYQKVGTSYRCINEHLFTMPDLNFICSDCGKEFNMDTARLETLNEYQLTTKGPQKLRLGLIEK